jgi:protein SCO1
MPEPTETPRRRLTGAVVPAMAAAGLAAVFAILLVGFNGEQRAQAPENCILEGAGDVGGPIDLIDANGARVTQADFAGQPALIYFGFTHCPDVCPLSMYAVAEAMAQPQSYDAQPILITLDPERDTPDVMRAYASTAGFPQGLVALTGSRAQVDAAKAAFHVYSARAPIEGADPETYNVDHSSFLYVVDGAWRTVAIIPTIVRERPQDPSSPIVAAPIAQISACIAAGLGAAN